MALCVGATELAKLRGLDGIFHSFGHGGQTECVRKADDGADDRNVFMFRAEARNEGTVNLDHIHGDALQVCQGRIAGSKVVQGNRDTQIPELLHGGDIGAVAFEQG